MANTNLGKSAGEVLTAAEVNRLLSDDGSGKWGLGMSSPTYFIDALDSNESGIVRLAQLSTVGTNKHCRIITRHYNGVNNAMGFYLQSNELVNNIIIGGGTTAAYAATHIKFYTANDNTTVTGTQRAIIDENGYFGVGVTPGWMLDVLDDRASNFVARFANDGNNENRNGISIRAGADDASGTTRYINCSDGDGDTIGYIENNSGTFQLVDSSDERLKEEIAQTTIKGIEAIKAIEVIDFTRKKSKERVIGGFGAGQLYNVCPHAVSGRPGEREEYEIEPEEKDEQGKTTKEAVKGERDKMMGIAKSELIPVLMKGMQEIIEHLKL